ncbi:MAG: cardiolipin synthase B [Acidobacteria bacterium]|nr:cardiolipin synthase B [Acidobacteriota bacterium]
MTWTIVALAGLAFVLWFVAVVFFTPPIDYRLTERLSPAGDDFLRVLQSTCLAQAHDGNLVTVLTDGARFYPAMQEAIAGARHSVHLEAYIFSRGQAAGLLTAALVDRARHGVEVRIVLDALGSLGMRGDSVRALRDAGCRVEFYQPPTWYRLHRLNNRTHRELLVVDGRVAFTGGAGVADWWLHATNGQPAWRDTMVRLEGPIVAALQGVFAENWLECSGEVLTGTAHWPALARSGPTRAVLIRSSPADRATLSRVVFQMLIEGAHESISISTPYFLPDRAFRRALRAAAVRGVRVRILIPGLRSDQRLVRVASLRRLPELLADGVRVYEYMPAMTHSKMLIVDGRWSVLGTTNLDNRSFEHNDEIDVAFDDEALAVRLSTDFELDLRASREITPASLDARPLSDRLLEPLSWLLERQQ